MSKFMERDFKGVWIPREIYLTKELSWSEKILLIEIDYLDTDPKKGCFASNQYLGKFLNLSAGRTANMISDLKAKGWIKQLFFDGKNRGLRTSFHGKKLHKNVKDKLHENVSDASRKRESEPSRKREHSNSLKKSLEIEEGEKSAREQMQPVLENDFIQDFNKAFPHYSLSIYQQEIIQDRIRDGTVWHRSLKFWAGNNYRPQSVEKLCNYYDELAAGKHNKEKQDGNYQQQREQQTIDDFNTIEAIRNRVNTRDQGI